MKSDEKIDLWCERGVPHSEIIARLPERSDRDCTMAVEWFKDFGILSPRVGIMIADLADRLRSSQQILKRVEPKIKEAVKAESLPEDLPMDAVMELNALTVEAYVRAVNER